MARKPRRAQVENLFRSLPRNHVPFYKANDGRPLLEVLTKAMPSAKAAKKGHPARIPMRGPRPLLSTSMPL